MTHLDAFRAALLEEGFDAAIVSNHINQRYLTDFSYHDGYVVVTANEAYLLADFRYEEAARAGASSDFRVICPEGGMLVEVAGLLSDHGCHRVAVEEASLTMESLERMKKAIPDRELIGGASAIFDRLRTFKTDRELDTIARAQAITDAAFSHILSKISPEMTEIDVALELEFFMRRSGAENVAFQTIAVSGKASSLPHGSPRNRKLESGFLTMDFGARVDGYCSDMTRTVVIGRADEEMKRLYHTVLRAQTAAIDAAAEGVSCHALDKIARDIIENAGYHGCFGHSLGHGVGMMVHESPRLAPSADPKILLSRGHVVTVEPGIYLAETYGCRIEDMIAIREDGTLINFTKSPKDLIEIL